MSGLLTHRPVAMRTRYHSRMYGRARPKIEIVPGELAQAGEPQPAAVDAWVQRLAELSAPRWICHCTFRRPVGQERATRAADDWIVYLCRRCVGMEAVVVLERGGDGLVHVHAVVGALDDEGLLRRSWSHGLCRTRQLGSGAEDRGTRYVAEKLAVGRPVIMTAPAGSDDGRDDGGKMNEQKSARLDPALPARADMAAEGEEKKLEGEIRGILSSRRRSDAWVIVAVGMALNRLYRLRREAGHRDWRAYVEEGLGLAFQAACGWRRLARSFSVDELVSLGSARALMVLRVPASMREKLRKQAPGLTVRELRRRVSEARTRRNVVDLRGRYVRKPGARRRRR